MNEIIPCEGHSQNIKQSPSLGIVVATLPYSPWLSKIAQNQE
jgi:hypothetical protein